MLVHHKGSPPPPGPGPGPGPGPKYYKCDGSGACVQDKDGKYATLKACKQDLTKPACGPNTPCPYGYGPPSTYNEIQSLSPALPDPLPSPACAKLQPNWVIICPDIDPWTGKPLVEFTNINLVSGKVLWGENSTGSMPVALNPSTCKAITWPWSGRQQPYSGCIAFTSKDYKADSVQAWFNSNLTVGGTNETRDTIWFTFNQTAGLTWVAAPTNFKCTKHTWGAGTDWEYHALTIIIGRRKSKPSATQCTTAHH